MKKSIQKKIRQLLARSLVVLSFCMIVFNLVIVYRNTTRNAEIIMSKSCNSTALELNNQFKLVEQSVNNLYEISEAFRPSIEELRSEEKTNSYINQFRQAAITIAENTDGALAIYYRMNPDILHSGTTGFFYVKSAETEKFEENEITDLYGYDIYDTEHVGWYYAPVWAGKAVWMEPYYNANIDVEMISYVVPIYDKNTLVGVVGMDVDFGAIKDIAENLDVYESCGAVLCSMRNSSIYYNKCDLLGQAIPSDVYSQLQEKESSESIFFYRVDGENYGLFYQTLNNQMKVLIYASEEEIYSQGRVTVYIEVIVFFVVFMITLVLALKMSKRIIKPISDITEASKKYAQGVWSVRVTCDTQDELQLLAKNISIMADKTEEYIQFIQDMANKDALTGLGNRTAYVQYKHVIKQEHISNGTPFAIVVFDVNNLKKVNDNYGHEKGDALISSAGKTISNAFSKSPVFRIGGDEFVAIVKGEDFENRKAIVEEFHKHMQQSKNSQDIMQVCIACGMAECGDDGASFDEVFVVADQRMYENKVDLKDGEKPR